MNTLDIRKYATIVFDCDGVVLNSNRIKTQAFYHAALSYGAEAAEALVAYHQQYGGVSRYKKFEYFLTDILGIPVDTTKLDELIACYAEEVRHKLLTCEVSLALQSLREVTAESKWLIASGGDQAELRNIFEVRDLAHFFDGGIFGSPDSKELIVCREVSTSNITFPALLIGDSQYDYVAAEKAGLDFLFVNQWTEFVGWETFQSEKDFPVVPGLLSLVEENVLDA